MKIYDCFTFFNELDLLEIRLAELYDYVDYFVIAEGDKNFRGAKKEFNYLINKKRFSKWADKIIYIPVKMPPLNFFERGLIYLMESKFLPRFGTNSLGLNGLSSALGIGRWRGVYFQRDSLAKGLKDIQESDLILLSDVDEIPDVKNFKCLSPQTKFKEYYYFYHRMFYYALNGLCEDELWKGTVGLNFLTFKKFHKLKFHEVRDISLREKVLSLIGYKRNVISFNLGGWHFNSLGTNEHISIKKNSAAESILLNYSKELIEKDIAKGIFRHSSKKISKIKYVSLDQTFPKEIYSNKKRYLHLLKKPNTPIQQTI